MMVMLAAWLSEMYACDDDSVFVCLLASIHKS